jgi:hypothetical protein
VCLLFVSYLFFCFYSQYLSIAFDGNTGLLKNMTNLHDKVSIDVTQKFDYYFGHNGNNSQPEFQASGAYIFRPNGSKEQLGAKITAKSYIMQVSSFKIGFCSSYYGCFFNCCFKFHMRNPRKFLHRLKRIKRPTHLCNFMLICFISNIC